MTAMPRYLFAGFIGLLSLAACAPMVSAGPDKSLTGIVWRAEDIGGGGIIDSSYATIALGPNDTAIGSASCNRYTARYTLANNRLTISNISSTEKACAPSLMQQEARYIALLTRVSNWRIEPTGALVLTTTDGAPLRFFPEE